MVRVPFTVRHLCLSCSTTSVPIVLLSDVIEALLRCCQATARTFLTIYIYIYIRTYELVTLKKTTKCGRNIGVKQKSNGSSSFVINLYVHMDINIFFAPNSRGLAPEARQIWKNAERILN